MAEAVAEAVARLPAALCRCDVGAAAAEAQAAASRVAGELAAHNAEQWGGGLTLGREDGGRRRGVSEAGTGVEADGDVREGSGGGNGTAVVPPVAERRVSSSGGGLPSPRLGSVRGWGVAQAASIAAAAGGRGDPGPAVADAAVEAAAVAAAAAGESGGGGPGGGPAPSTSPSLFEYFFGGAGGAAGRTASATVGGAAQPVAKSTADGPLDRTPSQSLPGAPPALASAGPRHPAMQLAPERTKSTTAPEDQDSGTAAKAAAAAAAAVQRTSAGGAAAASTPAMHPAAAGTAAGAPSSSPAPAGDSSLQAAALAVPSPHKVRPASLVCALLQDLQDRCGLLHLALHTCGAPGQRAGLGAVVGDAQDPVAAAGGARGDNDQGLVLSWRHEVVAVVDPGEEAERIAREVVGAGAGAGGVRAPSLSQLFAAAGGAGPLAAAGGGCRSYTLLARQEVWPLGAAGGGGPVASLLLQVRQRAHPSYILIGTIELAVLPSNVPACGARLAYVF